MFAPLDDDVLFPLQTEEGRALLKRLREHPHAPVYNWRTGERLTAEGLADVRAYDERLRGGRRGWQFGEVPAWLAEFVAYCRREVPYHRGRADWTDDFFALPPTTRQVLRGRPWELVPDSLPLDDLVVFTSSGTTGPRLCVISHPVAPARYLPAIRLMVERAGATLDGGPGRVSIVHVCAQREAAVMTSVSSYLGGAGFVKVNLVPHDWRDLADAAVFLDDCDAEVYTGDPFAFAELMKLPLRTRPKAIVSAATALLPGLRDRLAPHFGCPVIDLYSMSESGPIAFRIGDEGHEILPHNLYVEVLDEAGRPCPPGVRGEVTVSGGINPFLPLLRYPTGDFAAMDYSGAVPRLVGLQGRAPTVFRKGDGGPMNAMDVTRALENLPLAHFSLHQRADGGVEFRGSGEAMGAAAGRVRGLFGAGVAVDVVDAGGQPLEGKAINYSSEVEW